MDNHPVPERDHRTDEALRRRIWISERLNDRLLGQPP